jgi:hypothetical protein
MFTNHKSSKFNNNLKYTKNSKIFKMIIPKVGNMLESPFGSMFVAAFLFNRDFISFGYKT